MKKLSLFVVAAAVLSVFLPAGAVNLPGTLSEDGKTYWIDGRNLPLEGRAFPDAELPYQRMPDRIKAMTNVNYGVWVQGQCSAGMLFRFNVKKSNLLKVRWSVKYEQLAGGNMSPFVKSGVDFYGWDSKRGEWRFQNCAKPTRKDGNEQLLWVPGSGDVMLYLPCYNGTTKFEIGVAPTAEISPISRRRHGIGKPIVFYGTSITQGGCVSRPGLAYPALVSRKFDAPHVNLGFSGNGRMEKEMADMLLEIDASCYVLDCLWNMKYEQVVERFEPFLLKLKAAKPDVPVLTVEMCVVDNKPNKASLFIRGVVEKLKKENPVKWANLRHLPAERLYFNDGEGTIDRCHPNDWGMMKLSAEMTKEIRKLFKCSATPKMSSVYTVPHELDMLIKAGHIQGACCSTQGIYLSHQLGIAKISWEGKLLKTMEAPAHLGDIAYADGKIYGAFVVRDEKQRKNGLRGLVRVWDEDFKLLAEKWVPESLDGITVLGDTVYVGVDRWGLGKHPLCSVKRLNLALEDLGNADVDLGFKIDFGVQTMSNDGKNLYFGCYGGTACVSPDLTRVEKVDFGCSEGFDLVPSTVAKCGGKIFFVVRAMGGNMQGWRKDPINNPPRIRLDFHELKDGRFFYIGKSSGDLPDA